MEEFKCYNLDYPVGCIIAKVNIIDSVKVDDDFRGALKSENSLVYNHVIMDKMWQGYGFKMDNARLVKPIYINGKLGFWNYDGKISFRE